MNAFIKNNHCLYQHAKINSEILQKIMLFFALRDVYISKMTGSRLLQNVMDAHTIFHEISFGFIIFRFVDDSTFIFLAYNLIPSSYINGFKDVMYRLIYNEFFYIISM